MKIQLKKEYCWPKKKCGTCSSAGAVQNRKLKRVWKRMRLEIEKLRGCAGAVHKIVSVPFFLLHVSQPAET